MEYCGCHHTAKCLTRSRPHRKILPTGCCGQNHTAKYFPQGAVVVTTLQIISHRVSGLLPHCKILSHRVLWSRPHCKILKTGCCGCDHDCNLHYFFIHGLNCLIFVLFSSFLTLVFECVVATKPTLLYSNEGLFPQS